MVQPDLFFLQNSARKSDTKCQHNGIVSPSQQTTRQVGWKLVSTAIVAKFTDANFCKEYLNSQVQRY